MCYDTQTYLIGTTPYQPLNGKSIPITYESTPCSVVFINCLALKDQDTSAFF